MCKISNASPSRNFTVMQLCIIFQIHDLPFTSPLTNPLLFNLILLHVFKPFFVPDSAPMCAAKQILVCRGWAALLARPSPPLMGGPPHASAALYATRPDQSAPAVAAPLSEVGIL
jgi:hypothetical protein